MRASAIEILGAAGGGSEYVTTYAYDKFGHLVNVNMPRLTGTQNRTFNYSGAFLMSATNPENGTVSYTYNSNQKIATKTDAKGQQTQYSYETYGRLSEVRHYVGGVEDACQRVNYYYDVDSGTGYSRTTSRGGWPLWCTSMRTLTLRAAIRRLRNCIRTTPRARAWENRSGSREVVYT